MSLIDIRKGFLEETGRFDLVDSTTYANKGADRYIRAGQRWLDRTFDIAANNGKYLTTLAIDDWYALIPEVRVIQTVQMSSSTRDKVFLCHAPFEEFRSQWPEDPTTVTVGFPAYFTLASLRTTPEALSLTTIAQWATVVTSSVDNYGYNGLLWMPPLEEAATLEVHGKFYQPVLRGDGDINFWTEQELDVLVHAACRALEISHRNTAGVRDWEFAIRSDMLGLEHDFAEQEAAFTTGFEG